MSGMPIMAVAGLAVAIVSFVADKKLIRHLFRRSPTQGTSVLAYMVEMLPAAAMVHAALACWILSQIANMASEPTDIMPEGDSGRRRALSQILGSNSTSGSGSLFAASAEDLGGFMMTAGATAFTMLLHQLQGGVAVAAPQGGADVAAPQGGEHSYTQALPHGLPSFEGLGNADFVSLPALYAFAAPTPFVKPDDRESQMRRGVQAVVRARAVPVPSVSAQAALPALPPLRAGTNFGVSTSAASPPPPPLLRAGADSSAAYMITEAAQGRRLTTCSLSVGCASNAMGCPCTSSCGVNILIGNSVPWCYVSAQNCVGFAQSYFTPSDPSVFYAGSQRFGIINPTPYQYCDAPYVPPPTPTPTPSPTPSPTATPSASPTTGAAPSPSSSPSSALTCLPSVSTCSTNGCTCDPSIGCVNEKLSDGTYQNVCRESAGKSVARRNQAASMDASARVQPLAGARARARATSSKLEAHVRAYIIAPYLTALRVPILSPCARRRGAGLRCCAVRQLRRRVRHVSAAVLPRHQLVHHVRRTTHVRFLRRLFLARLVHGARSVQLLVRLPGDHSTQLPGGQGVQHERLHLRGRGHRLRPERPLFRRHVRLGLQRQLQLPCRKVRQPVRLYRHMPAARGKLLQLHGLPLQRLVQRAPGVQ
jgi:hypothetical protein